MADPIRPTPKMLGVKMELDQGKLMELGTEIGEVSVALARLRTNARQVPEVFAGVERSHAELQKAFREWEKAWRKSTKSQPY